MKNMKYIDLLIFKRGTTLAIGCAERSTFNPFFLEFSMRTLISTAALFALSFAAVAGGGNPLPEPGVIALVGVGVAALLVSRRSKK